MAGTTVTMSASRPAPQKVFKLEDLHEAALHIQERPRRHQRRHPLRPVRRLRHRLPRGRPEAEQVRGGDDRQAPVRGLLHVHRLLREGRLPAPPGLARAVQVHGLRHLRQGLPTRRAGDRRRPGSRPPNHLTRGHRDELRPTRRHPPLQRGLHPAHRIPRGPRRHQGRPPGAAEVAFTPSLPERGYNGRSLYVDLGTREVRGKAGHRSR